MLLLITLLIVVEIVLLWTYVGIRRQSASGPPLWIHEALLFAQSLYWLGSGTLIFLDDTGPGRRFVMMSCVAQISLTVGCLVSISGFTEQRPPIMRISKTEEKLALGIGLFSAAICVLFVLIVVLNQDLGPILLSVITGDEDFVSYRLIMSTGRAIYLAPGYVKQFRDVLLTCSFLVLMIGRKTSRWLLTILWVSGFVAAVLSGERSVLMIHVYILGIGLIYKQGRSAAARRTIIIATVSLGVSAFVGFTFLLGRTTIGASIFKVFAESVWGLFSRVALVVPSENAESFPFWESLVPTWGSSWGSELLSILPGVQNSFSNDLHALLGGSPLGNSTLGLSADTFLAWGITGIIVVPFLYAVMLGRIDKYLFTSPYPSARIARLAFMPLTLAWYSPFLFILNGGFVMTFFAFIARPRVRHPAEDAALEAA